MPQNPLRIIHLSDTHVMADQQAPLLGVKTCDSFHAVVDLMKKEKGNIDFILHSGDMSQDGSEISYKHIAETLSEFNVPVYCVPGNHDVPQTMSQVYPLHNISDQRHVILKNWHIILLNSHKENSVAGVLDQSQLDYLQQCLQIYPEHHAIIVFHHQPLPVGCEWLDKIGLTNADAFWEIVSQYPRVNTVLFGHVHQVFEKNVNGVRCISAPSTCFQFHRDQAKFGLEKLAQGYRWLHFYDDGHLETDVERTAEYVGHFDENAKGY